MLMLRQHSNAEFPSSVFEENVQNFYPFQNSQESPESASVAEANQESEALVRFTCGAPSDEEFHEDGVKNTNTARQCSFLKNGPNTDSSFISGCNAMIIGAPKQSSRKRFSINK